MQLKTVTFFGGGKTTNRNNTKKRARRTKRFERIAWVPKVIRRILLSAPAR